MCARRRIIPDKHKGRRCLHIGCVRLAQNGDHSYHRCFRKRFGRILFVRHPARAIDMRAVLTDPRRSRSFLRLQGEFFSPLAVRSRDRILRMPCAVSLGISDGQRFRYRSRAVRAVRVLRAPDLRFHSFVVAEMHA